MIKTVDDFKEFVGNEGKLFSVKFLKSDYSERTMVARLGVRSYSKGGKPNYDTKSRNNIVVFSMDDMGYRTINIDRLLKVKAYGNTLTV